MKPPLLSLLSVTGLATLAFAGTGSDDCSSPHLITGYGQKVWINVGATTSGSDCGMLFFDDVWFRWVAPHSGPTDIAICGTTTIDTRLAVYEGNGCPASGAALDCNDNACGLQSAVQFDAVVGRSYVIRVGGAASGVEGGGTIDIQPHVRNDHCETAQAISGSGIFSGDNTGAVGSGVLYGCPSERDVWYRWIAPSSGPWTVSTCGMTSMDSEINVYRGPCTNLEYMGCSSECDDLGDVLQFTATGGVTYLIRIGTENGPSGPFSFELAPTQPVHDDCLDAFPLYGEASFVASTGGATTDGHDEPGCGFSGGTTIEKDVWYEWIPSESGLYEIDGCQSDFDTRLAVYAGPGCDTGTPLGCADDSCGQASRVTVEVAGGARYRIRQGSAPGDFGGRARLSITKLADSAESLGEPYCAAGANSAHGQGARLRAFGSASLAIDFLQLAVDRLPGQRTGLFFYGANRLFAPFGEGIRCVGGETRRLNPPLQSSPAGLVGLVLDFDTPPIADDLTPGATWHFQYWYRDPSGGPHGFNFSQGLTLTTTP